MWGSWRLSWTGSRQAKTTHDCIRQVWFCRGWIARNRVVWGSWRLAHDFAEFLASNITGNLIVYYPKSNHHGSLIVTFSFRAVIVRVIKEQVFLLGRKFKFSRERIVAKSCSVRTLTILSRFDWIVVAQSQTKKSYNVRPPLGTH